MRPKRRRIVLLRRSIRWPFADRNRIDDLALRMSVSAGVLRAADPPLGAKVLNQLLFQRSARLNEQAAINRFVRHAQALVVRIGLFQPSGNLLRRPVLHQFTRNESAELLVEGQAAGLGPQSRFPGLLVGLVGSILRAPAMAGQLSADRRCRALRCWAMTRSEEPLATPREMSSRSANVSARRERIPSVFGTPRHHIAITWIQSLADARGTGRLTRLNSKNPGALHGTRRDGRFRHKERH